MVSEGKKRLLEGLVVWWFGSSVVWMALCVGINLFFGVSVFMSLSHSLFCFKHWDDESYEEGSLDAQVVRL